MILSRPKAVFLFAIAALLAAWPAPVLAQFLPPPIVDPARYMSPSGEYALIVDPDDRYGEGGASYRLARDGRAVWLGHRPFTLLGAGVGDDGSCGGYTYSGSRFGPLEIAVFSRSGKLLRDERIERKFSGVPDSAALPIGEGAFAEPARNRLVVRLGVLGDPSEIWRQYSLSTGERLPDYDPIRLLSRHEPYASVGAAASVAGTPLTLVQWSDDGDAIFQLIDASRKVVWTRRFPNDYPIEERDDRRQALIDNARECAIFPSASPGRFALWSVARDSRITYRVTRTGPGKWRVVGVARESYPAPVSAPPPIPKVALRPLDSFDLTVPGQTPLPSIPGVQRLPGGTLHEIGSMAIDQAGRISAIDRRSAVVQVFDSRGVWLHAYRFGDPKGDGSLHVIPLTCSPRGDILLAGLLPNTLLRIAPDGRRLPDLELRKVSASASAVVSSRKAASWVVLGDRVALIAQDGRILRVVTHRADGKWFDFIKRAIRADDGSLAVYDENFPLDNGACSCLSLYSSLGDHLRTIVLPASLGTVNGVTYNGRLIVVSAGETLYGISLTGRFLWRFKPPVSGDDLEPFFTDGGKTLLIWTGGTHIDRYTLPR